MSRGRYRYVQRRDSPHIFKKQIRLSPVEISSHSFVRIQEQMYET